MIPTKLNNNFENDFDFVSSVIRPTICAFLPETFFTKSTETTLFVVPVETNTVKFRILEQNLKNKLCKTGIEFDLSDPFRVNYVKGNNDCSFNYSIVNRNCSFQSFRKSYDSGHIFVAENLKFIADLRKLKINVEIFNFDDSFVPCLENFYNPKDPKKSTLQKREKASSKCLNVTAGTVAFAPKELRNPEDLCDKVFFPIIKIFYETLEKLYVENESDATKILYIFENQIDHYCYNDSDVERITKINEKLGGFFKKEKLTVNAHIVEQELGLYTPLKVSKNPDLKELMPKYPVCTTAPNWDPSNNRSNVSGSWYVQREFFTGLVRDWDDQIESFKNCGVKSAILKGMRVLFVHAPGAGDNKGAAYNAKSVEEWITLMHKVTSLSIAMQIITLCNIDNVYCPQLSNFITSFLKKFE